MSTEVDKVIAKMAVRHESKIDPPISAVFNTRDISIARQVCLSSYSAGAKDMKEHLGGLLNWVGENDFGYESGIRKWASTYEYNTDETALTTDQLIEKYFEEVLKS